MDEIDYGFDEVKGKALERIIIMRGRLVKSLKCDITSYESKLSVDKYFYAAISELSNEGLVEVVGNKIFATPVAKPVWYSSPCKISKDWTISHDKVAESIIKSLNKMKGMHISALPMSSSYGREIGRKGLFLVLRKLEDAGMVVNGVEQRIFIGTDERYGKKK